MSLDAAIAKAKARLEALRAREEALVEESGIRSLIAQLTAENQLLNERRGEARARVDELEKTLAQAREHGAMLELQIKGARARVQKLASLPERR